MWRDGTLPPTEEQEIEAGIYAGPNLTDDRAHMVLRVLGYEHTRELCVFDADELLGRVRLAMDFEPITDTGMDGWQDGAMIQCAIPAGYFQRVFGDLALLCEQARQWDAPIYAV